MSRPVFIYKRIHSGAASFSSSDVSLFVSDSEKNFELNGSTISSKKYPFLNSEQVSSIDKDSRIMIVYIKGDERFSELAMRTRNPFFTEFEKTPEFKEHVESYVNRGWILEKGLDQKIKDFYKRKEIIQARKDKKAGLVLWQTYDDRKNSPISVYQGGFSDEVFNTEKMQNYLSTRAVFGWIGNYSVRKVAHDKAIEAGLRKRGASPELMYSWISSSDGRHFAEALGDLETLEEQLERIEKYLNRMFNLALIFSSEFHRGTLKSTHEVEEDYKKQGLLLPEDESGYDENAHFKLMAAFLQSMNPNK